MLNYGHTIGHAVESAGRFELLHGQAVAIGIVAAGLNEKKLALADDERLQRIKTILHKLDAPTAIPPNIPKAAVWDLLKHDKKSINQWPRFVLLDRIGHVHCRDGQWAIDIDRQIVADVIDNLY